MGGVFGIIAEYNPMHNGHIYHLNESKKATNATATVVVMSGNFVQRGDTSVINKWTKTSMALANGADLVIELPILYSISSAENFALGAIKILNSLNVIDTLSFGCETSDLSILKQFANVLSTEPKEYVTILNHELAKGISYPKARENALLLYLNDIRKYANVLSNPNNILGIEYLKALKKLKSNIEPLGITRKFVTYDEDKIVNGYTNASTIRKMIMAHKKATLAKVMPENCYNSLQEDMSYGQYVTSITRFEKEIIFSFRKMSLDEITNLPDVTEGLQNAIKKAVDSSNTLSEFLEKVKSKRYTQTRLQRICLYALLGITKKDMLAAQRNTPYVRVLGFTPNGENLLSAIAHKNKKLAIITSVKKFKDSNTNKFYDRLLDLDIMATNIYTLGYEYDSFANLDYTNKMIKYHGTT